ncbi:hypothetical protein [Maritimibacter sp. DP1N21-5]|uniref:hypothetical protein n=1 Tax=Maritimibacter sp. DP1N21-5 TaxID=2836867 RepID=UPI001C47CD82|nr:hypothetical protein [Maritimibacter sp. DP1N21-5]MBV7407371.1 hypothetical protein [Maritimibacter sp. DP1N21-5]
MAMFSMKPKFDLAEFLDKPASVGSRKSRVGKRSGPRFQSATGQTDADEIDKPDPEADPLKGD